MSDATSPAARAQTGTRPASPGSTPAAWLGFELSGQAYAVPLARVREVIRYAPPTPVPGAPGDVLGIINLRGSIMTVLDGSRRLGLASANADDAKSLPDARCIIFDFTEEAVAVRIDRIGEVIDLGDTDVEPPPPGRADRGEDPVEGVVPFQGGFIALLDVACLCRMKGNV